MALYKKGFQGNVQIRSSGVPIEWDQFKLQEFEKCSTDPLYFIQTYVKIKHVDFEELIPFIPRNYQQEMLEKMLSERYVIVKLPRQAGKCCSINTLVKIRNRLTGETSDITVGKLYERSSGLSNLWLSGKESSQSYQETRNESIRLQGKVSERTDRFRIYEKEAVSSFKNHDKKKKAISRETSPRITQEEKCRCARSSRPEHRLDDETRVDVREKGGARLRRLSDLWVSGSDPLDSCQQSSWIESSDVLWADAVRGTERVRLGEAQGRQEPLGQPRRQVLALVEEIHRGGPRSLREHTESAREQSSQLFAGVFSKQDGWERGGSQGTSDREAENVYSGEVYREVWGGGGSSSLAEASGQVAGDAQFQDGRGDRRDQSKETLSWGDDLKNRTRNHGENTSSSTRSQSSVSTQEWNSKLVPLRFCSGQSNHRVQWRFLACPSEEIWSGRHHSEQLQNERSGDLGERRKKTQSCQGSGIRGDGRLGERLQEGTGSSRGGVRRLSDGIERKFVDSRELHELDVWTDSGWQPATRIMLTVPYSKWVVRTETGRELECADDHILFDLDMDEVFVKDLRPGDLVRVEGGFERVVSVVNTGAEENMFDIEVDSPDHRYFTDGFLSHNTTLVSAVLLWHIIFHLNFSILVAAHKGDKARDVLSSIKAMFENLPEFLQHGVLEYNKGTLILENGSRVRASATSGSAARGDTYNLCYIDEAGFIATHVADEFFKSVIPTISSGKSTKIFITSTPKGLNHFYTMWTAAVSGKSGYAHVEIKWNDVPGRDEKFREEVIAQFGQEYFDQEYAAEFLGSSRTLIAGWKLTTIAVETPIYSGENVRVYAEPERGHRYAMTVDVSEGLGADYSAAVIFDITSMPYRPVSVYRNNLIQPMALPGLIHEMATTYNDALVLVEANFGGQVGEILHQEYEYENVVMTARGKANDSISMYGNTRVGLAWNNVSKRIGCTNLKSLVEHDQLMVTDQWIYDELTRFAVKGKSYAAEDGHDDLAMCLVMFGWMVEQGYVRDDTDVDVRNRIASLNEEAIERDMLPLGFRFDGHEDDHEAIELRTPAIEIPHGHEESRWGDMFHKPTARHQLSDAELHDAFMRQFFSGAPHSAE